MERAVEQPGNLLQNVHKRYFRHYHIVYQTIVHVRQRNLPHAAAGIFPVAESHGIAPAGKDQFVIGIAGYIDSMQIHNGVVQGVEIDIPSALSALFLTIDHLAHMRVKPYSADIGHVQRLASVTLHPDYVHQQISAAEHRIQSLIHII